MQTYKSLAPIALFCYNRLDSLKLAIDALKLNIHASESILYIFSDAPKNNFHEENVNKVRSYLKTITGFKKVIIKEAEFNNGLAKSIIGGVTQILNNYGKIIVLEDDLITSKNFLSYMNQALDFYEDNNKVFSISGYTTLIKDIDNNEIFFTKRSSSWGWATWKDRWIDIDWDVKDYKSFSKSKHLRSEFNKMGSDLSSMLDKQMIGKINSWAIRWCYHQFKTNKFTVYPSISKVSNIGFDSDLATHTKEKFNRFATVLDNSSSINFKFTDDPNLNQKYIKQFVFPYSIPVRIFYKFLNSIYNLF